MKLFQLTFLIISVLVCVAVNAVKTDFKVTFVSVDHVYIDGGKIDGLGVGDKLKLTGQKNSKAALEIVYISEHSSSCIIIDGSQDFAVGTAVSRLKGGGAAKKGASLSSSSKNPETVPPSFGPPALVSGNVAIGFNQWFDNSAANLDFTQSNARLNLIVSNLFRGDITLAVRTRSRYDIRTKAYDGGAGRTNWENRLWELSLTYFSPKSMLSSSLGRILPRRLGSIGYLDGAMFDFRLNRAMALGLFGGQQPSWLYSSAEDEIIKIGFYGEYKTDVNAVNQVQQAIGFVREQHGASISRAFVASSGRVRFGRLWGFSHTVEMDINTGWRKERAGKTYAISNLYLHTDYQLNPKVRTSLNYDIRTSYLTYQYRSLPDSLFDDRTNHGLRVSVEYTPLKKIWLSGALGYRKPKQGTDPTINYSTTGRISQLLNTPFSVSTFVSGFSGPFEYGTNYRIGLDVDIRFIGAVSTGFSKYVYTVEGQSPDRTSRSLEFTFFKDFSKNYYFGSTFHSDSGDDIDGLRLQFELGYRY